MRKNCFPELVTFYVMNIYNGINKGKKPYRFFFLKIYFTLHFYSTLRVVSLDAEQKEYNLVNSKQLSPSVSIYVEILSTSHKENIKEGMHVL